MRGHRIFEHGDHMIGEIVEAVELDPADREVLESLVGEDFSAEFVATIESGLSDFRHLFSARRQTAKAGDIRKTLEKLASMKDDDALVDAYRNSGQAVAEVERQILFKRKDADTPLANLVPRSPNEIRECAHAAVIWFDAQHYGERDGGRPAKEPVRALVIPWALELWRQVGKAHCGIGIDRVTGKPSPCLGWVCTLIGLVEDVANSYPLVVPDPRDVAKLIKKSGTVSPM